MVGNRLCGPPLLTEALCLCTLQVTFMWSHLHPEALNLGLANQSSDPLDYMVGSDIGALGSQGHTLKRPGSFSTSPGP